MEPRDRRTTPSSSSAENTVAELTRAIQSPDWTTSAHASAALAHLGDDGFTALTTVLGDPDMGSEARRRAAQGLAQSGDPGALNPLVAALQQDRDGFLQMTAAIALGQLGVPEGVPALLAALADAEFAWGSAAENALVRIGSMAVPFLIDVLPTGTPSLLKHAATALGRIGDPRALGPLLVLLADPDAGVRWRAVEGLAWLRDPQAVPALLPLLADPDANVRANTAEALGSLGGAEAVSALELLRQDDAITWEGDPVATIADDAILRIRRRLEEPAPE